MHKPLCKPHNYPRMTAQGMEQQGPGLISTRGGLNFEAAMTAVSGLAAEQGPLTRIHAGSNVLYCVILPPSLEIFGSSSDWSHGRGRYQGAAVLFSRCRVPVLGGSL